MKQSQRSAPARTAPPIEPARVRRWLEYVEFAIDADTERTRVDTLLELAESLETALGTLGREGAQ